MNIDISKMSVEKINLLFLDKLKDYLSLMSNFMSPEEIDERRNIVVDNFKELITTYTNQKKEHNLYVKAYDKLKNDVKFLDTFSQVDYNYETSKSKIEGLFKSEILFLNYITTNFELNNMEDHGVVHKSSDESIHNEGINTALTYSVINTMAFTKERKGEPFNYPKEMETSDEVSLYQIKDVLAIDMMEIFGMDILKDFFMGNGKGFNDKFRHLMTVVSTTEGELPTDEEIAKATLKNMKDFEEGVNKSFKENDEMYIAGYISLMKLLKGAAKTVDFTYSDEVIQKVNKGLK